MTLLPLLLPLLLEEFKFYHPGLVVKAILTDALYGSGWFMNRAAEMFGTQTISQLSKSQKIRFRNRAFWGRYFLRAVDLRSY